MKESYSSSQEEEEEEYISLPFIAKESSSLSSSSSDEEIDENKLIKCIHCNYTERYGNFSSVRDTIMSEKDAFYCTECCNCVCSQCFEEIQEFYQCCLL